MNSAHFGTVALFAIMFTIMALLIWMDTMGVR